MMLSFQTLVTGSAPTSRVIGRMPWALGMKRRRAVTVVLGRDATSCDVRVFHCPFDRCSLGKNTTNQNHFSLKSAFMEDQ